MKISVIIPTFNEEKFIAQCLASLDNQNYKDFEVIIVDDGSNDKTREIVKSYNSINYKLRLLTQDHKGPGPARNKGAEASNGEILVFVDADMTFARNFIRELTLPIREKKAIGTSSNSEYVGNWENAWARCWNINEGIKGKGRHNIGKKESIVFRAIRKKDFLTVGGYDSGGYTDDHSLGRKMIAIPVNSSKARFYHNNPDTIVDVYKQSKWAAKRAYKFGFLGVIFTIIKSLLPFSIAIGITKAIIYKESRFIFFKIVYDWARIMGIVEYYLKGKGAK